MESDSSAVDAQASAQGKAPPERKFYCTFDPNCKSRFSRSEHLQRHIRKHTGERPFKCDCGRTFSRMDNLRQHAQTVHAGDETNLAAWPATKIVPVTPVAPLPAEARVQHRAPSAGATPDGKSTPSSSKPAGVLASAKKDGKSGTATSASVTAIASVAVRSAPGSAGKRVGTSGQRAADEARPYLKASDRPKKSPRHAVTTTADTTKSATRTPTTRKGRERNYESFMNNLSLYRPSILHHLDESQHGGVYGKRRSMGHQPTSTQPPSLLAPGGGEPLAVPPYHSVRSAELPPLVSFDRYTPGRFDDASKSAGQSTQEKESINSSSNASQTSTTRHVPPGEIGQTKFSGAVHGNIAKARQMSIASLCSTDDSSSSDAVLQGTRPLHFGHHMQQHESIFARERQAEQMRAATNGSPASRPSNNQNMQVLAETAAMAAT